MWRQKARIPRWWRSKIASKAASDPPRTRSTSRSSETSRNSRAGTLTPGPCSSVNAADTSARMVGRLDLEENDGVRDEQDREENRPAIEVALHQRTTRRAARGADAERA